MIWDKKRRRSKLSKIICCNYENLYKKYIFASFKLPWNYQSEEAFLQSFWYHSSLFSRCSLSKTVISLWTILRYTAPWRCMVFYFFYDLLAVHKLLDSIVASLSLILYGEINIQKEIAKEEYTKVVSIIKR